MHRVLHGESLKLEQTAAGLAETSRIKADVAITEGLARSDVSALHPELTHFDHLFRDLVEDRDNLLEESPETVRKLKALGETMQDPGERIPDSEIPSAYTYFGQFVTHEIIFEDASRQIVNIADPDIKPISLERIRKDIVNTRSPNLDLDSVYGAGSVRDHDWMRIGRVSYSPNGRPEGKGVYNDLPRSERSRKNEERDRAARIGDKRNDENLIISQMHVAFLHAHNKLINQRSALTGRRYGFDEARTLITQHYQYILLNDFLKRIVDPEILKRCSIREKNEFVCRPDNTLFMPLEFSAAAFRFGHSMVRAAYNQFNSVNRTAGLDMLFDFTRFSGQLGGRGHEENSDTLTEDWIIDWKQFVDKGANRARPIDTTLVEPLFHLSPDIGARLPTEASLAVRNLIRGYILRLPTGQALARRMNITPLTASEIESVAQKVSDAQLRAVTDVKESQSPQSQFTRRTPLWYYILAEAAHGGKGHLGPVGSTLVAEVLIALLRRTDHSILSPPFTPENLFKPTPPFSSTGEFGLSDFLRFAGVLDER